MVNINTNLSSYLVQRNLSKSTNALNEAIERLSTGFKINHASDNAANYFVAGSYESKLSSYNVAMDNIECGLDMLATAQDSISLMQNLGTRLHALITQAQNGTYGTTSLSALNAEGAAIIAEIDRLFVNTEYNGNKLFRYGEHAPEMELPEWVDELNSTLDTSRYDGFIAKANNTEQSYIEGLKHVSEETTDFTATTYQISTKEDLEKLAELVNSGKDTKNKKFYLAADIDLEGEAWIPIGNRSASSSYVFKGTFDGNGHVIKNLKISNSSKNYQGLFGSANSNSTIKNVGIENAEVKGKDYTGLLVGYSEGTVTNCYTNGKVEGNERLGGLAGNTTKDVSDCYSKSAVSGKKYAGGLIGYSSKNVNRCFTEGTVITTGDYAAGLIGCTDGKIENCYSKSNVRGNNIVSGIVGRTAGDISNTYATGDADGYEFVGGVAGILKKTNGTMNVDTILSLGQITAVQKSGSLIGGVENTSATKAPYNFATVNITNGFVLEQVLESIGGAYTTATGNAPVPYDITGWLNNVTLLHKPDPVTSNITFQVGINGNEASSISIDTSMNYDLSYIIENGVQSEGAYDAVNNFLQTLSLHATEFGAVSNRLESALDTVNTNILNITSSLSTIKDADVAKISSEYIKQQILQQAAATLLATANQAPSIALQLL